MADSAPAPAVQKTKKVSKPTNPSTHPKFSEMVVDAIKSLKERGGSSRAKILKYILVNYKVNENSANNYLKMALKRGVVSGLLKQIKGTGASGSFSLGEAAKKAPTKPKDKKPTTKKPAAKKTATKKTPKKAATKKPVTKKTKSPAKKTTNKTKSPKKPTKKPAAKKTAKSPKKVAKKPAKKVAAKKTKA